MASEATNVHTAEASILPVNNLYPHIDGFPWYSWALKFYLSTNRRNFLCAANQISKSSTQIRKAINWSTDQTLWPKLWNLLPNQKPNQFWYFYPTFDVWQVEFETKWEPDFLPRGAARQHPIYGWQPVYDKGKIKQIDFNSGVTIYCKAYAQKLKDLQSGSVHAMFLDEEPPAEFMKELLARLRATNGYLNAVMTPTMGQEYWRRTFEPTDKQEEIFPGALKQTISLYDCQKYDDGTISQWDDIRIAEIIKECPTEADVQRRVYGRFVKSEGLRFESFDLQRNTTKPQPLQSTWTYYSAVDPGSGGKSGHPAAILFITVRPDFKKGWVFRGWRGDGIPTANPDILEQHTILKQDLLLQSQVYDYRDKDFFLVAQSKGENFQPANKARDEGFGLVNSLFKSGMLEIFRGDPELDKLINELQTLPKDIDKRSAKDKMADDLSDTLRYCCMSIPWDFSAITNLPKDKLMDKKPDTRPLHIIEQQERLKSRRDFVLNITENQADDEIEFWNEMAGND